MSRKVEERFTQCEEHSEKMKTVEKVKDKSKVKTLFKKKKKLEKKLRHVLSILAKNNENLEETSSDFSSVIDGSISSNDFIEVREKYFTLLQREVAINVAVVLAQNPLDNIEAISLQIEQRALLACMQTSIYEKVIQGTIRQLQNTTQTGSCHPLIAAAMVKSESNAVVSANMLHLEPRLATPVMPECQLDEGAINSQADPTEEIIPETVLSRTAYEPADSVKLNKPVSRVQPQTKVVTMEFESSSREGLEPGLTDFMLQCDKVESNCEEADLNVEGEANEDYEDDGSGHPYDLNIENLMHILEGTEEEPPSAIDERLDQMRDLFGYDSNDDSKTAPDELAHEPVESVTPCAHQAAPAAAEHPSPSSTMKIWRNERYIFMYKMFNRFTSMAPRKFFRTRKLLTHFFGDDSDYEQEEFFNDSEKFLASCARRILPTVVKYVMPFYKNRRICGGSYIFKNLVRRIADSLVDVTYYPSESDVERYVHKFFPDGKKFMNVSDVWCYQVDDDF